MHVLTEQEEHSLKDIPTTLWSQGAADVGLIKGIEPVEIRRPPSNYIKDNIH